MSVIHEKFTLGLYSYFTNDLPFVLKTIYERKHRESHQYIRCTHA